MRISEEPGDATRARVIIGGLLGIIEGDAERVASAMELLGVEDRDAFIEAAQEAMG